MTLKNLLKNYNNNGCLTVEGYCNEKKYDYLLYPDWVKTESDKSDFYEDNLSGNNPNHYVSECLFLEPWWNEVKNRKIDNWSILGGPGYKLELYITLSDECMNVGGRKRKIDKNKIKELRSQGKSYQDISEIVKCSKTYVIKVCNEK